MNKQSVIDGLSKISAVMTENKEYLIKLDQQNGRQGRKGIYAACWRVCYLHGDGRTFPDDLQAG